MCIFTVYARYARYAMFALCGQVYYLIMLHLSTLNFWSLHGFNHLQPSRKKSIPVTQGCSRPSWPELLKRPKSTQQKPVELVPAFSKSTLQGINISHLGKRKIIFKMPFLKDMLVSWRVSCPCWTCSGQRYAEFPKSTDHLPFFKARLQSGTAAIRDRWMVLCCVCSQAVAAKLNPGYIKTHFNLKISQWF